MSSGSLHRIAMGLDLDATAFTRELERAGQAFERTIEREFGSVRREAVVLDQALEDLVNGAMGDAMHQRLRQLEAQGETTFSELGQGARRYAEQLEFVGMEENRVELRARMMGEGAAGALRRMQQEGTRTNMLLGQMSFAIEDFFAVYETMGASGGFRAASNNLTMVARTLFSSVIVGNAVALGLALGPTLWRYLQGSTEEATKFKDILDGALNSLRLIDELENSRLQSKNKREDIRDITTVDGVENTLKQTTRELEAIEAKLKSLEAQAATASSTFMTQLFGTEEWNNQIDNVLSGINDGGRLKQAFLEITDEFQNAIRLNPERINEELAMFESRIAAWELRVQGAVAAGANGLSEQASAQFAIAMRPFRDTELLNTIQELAGDEEAIAAYLDIQLKIMEEQKKLQLDLQLTEQERLDAAKKKVELEKEAAAILQKSAQDTLAEKARSTEAAELSKIREAQLELIKLREQALGVNPGDELMAAVDRDFQFAMNRLLSDAARRFGDDLKQEIDHMQENLGGDRSRITAATTAANNALRQVMEAQRKSDDPNTEILREIRDAFNNRTLVGVPIQ
jgi:hypothetical protein